MGLHTHVSRMPGCFRGKHFGHVGFGAAGFASVEDTCSLVHHERCGLNFCVTTRDGELHALVLPDGSIEYDALFRAGGCLVDEIAAIADTIRGDEVSFRVHAVQNRPPPSA